ncbi:MAG: YopX family protein [Candidatus Babeliales bacterium]
MKLEIRAWNAVRREMVYLRADDSLCLWGSGSWIITGLLRPSKLSGILASGEGETLMMGPGVPDGNGRRFFEGDIAHHELPDDSGGTGVVRWNAARACFEIRGKDWFAPLSDSWVVIGNVHENPELVERCT